MQIERVLPRWDCGSLAQAAQFEDQEVGCVASGGLLLWSGAPPDQQLVPQWPRWPRAFQSRSVASLGAYAFATTSPTSTLSKVMTSPGN
jgi:hypothetical protein